MDGSTSLSSELELAGMFEASDYNSVAQVPALLGVISGALCGDLENDEER